MFKEGEDYVNFYYNVGILLGDYYGGISIYDRIKTVNQFKEFVEVSGGVETFDSSEQAFNRYLNYSKGPKRYGKRN